MKQNRSEMEPALKETEFPFSEWVRFSLSGRFVDCSEWLRGKWEASHLIDESEHARDFFCLNEQDGESFYHAWVSSMKGRQSEVSLRLKGRENTLSRCLFQPEGDEKDNLQSVLIGISHQDGAQPFFENSPDETLLASAFLGLSDPMCLFDRQGSALWANENGRRFLNLHGDGLWENLRASLNWETPTHCEIVVRAACGTPERLRIEAVPVPIRRGELSRMMIRFHEPEPQERDRSRALGMLEQLQTRLGSAIAGDERLATLLQELRQEIVALQKDGLAKSDFLASISHEIRTPMNAVIGFCDLLLSTQLSEEQGECVEAIYHSGKLLIQLLGQILDYSRIESGNLDFVEETIDLGQVLLEAQAIMSARVRSKNLKFEADFSDLDGACVVADPIRIKQIVVNLLGNAFKFTRSGRIAIEASSQRDDERGEVSLRVRVEDTGIGIDAERLNCLFQPFAQGSSRIARDFGGTGLGLAICKRLCLAMKGDIWVETTSKSGSVFCFEVKLPQAAQGVESGRSAEFDVAAEATSEQRKSREAMQAERARSAKVRVLVVDDNPNNLLITSKLSEHLGYQAKTVRSGVEAMDCLKKEPFEIILMDVRMAPINGMETTEKIRRGEAGDSNKDIYIIALTAHALQGDRERCLASGMNDYLSKPLTLEKLEESLDRAKEAISLD